MYDNIYDHTFLKFSHLKPQKISGSKYTSQILLKGYKLLTKVDQINKTKKAVPSFAPTSYGYSTKCSL